MSVYYAGSGGDYGTAISSARSDHAHDARYYTEGELNASGGGGQVHWDNLSNVPAGFADGIDDGLTAETDPVFTASAASVISSSDITNWNAAYGWGDHSTQGYLTHDFTGREWVFAEIDRWLADPNGPRFFIITGEPGIGKTAIAARLTQIRNLDAFHFCIARQADTIDPLNFACFLSHRLTRIDDFAQNLLEEQGIHLEVRVDVRENYGQIIGVQIETLVVEAPSATIAFNRAVLDPLRRLYANGFDRPLLILVDALDEAVQQRGPETIVDLLVNARGLPLQVRFILTSRPEGEALRHFEQLNIPYLVLEAGGAENQADVQAYVRYRLESSNSLRSRLIEEAVELDIFVERVTEASRGNFLYLVWLLRSVEEGTQRFDTLDVLPEGLDGIYCEFLRTRRPGEDVRVWRKRYRPLLGILAAAQEALSAEQLMRFAEMGAQGVGNFLLDVQQFLDPIGVAKGQYQLYHQSVLYLVLYLNNADKSRWLQTSNGECSEAILAWLSAPKGRQKVILVHQERQLRSAR